MIAHYEYEYKDDDVYVGDDYKRGDDKGARHVGDNDDDDDDDDMMSIYMMVDMMMMMILMVDVLVMMF